MASPTITNWKNVNNWHWVERDCTSWAHDQIKTRLGGLKVETEIFSVVITGVTKVSGDVTVTQRKGKLRHNFDLNITLTWKSGDEEEGIIEIRDFMSDTDKKGYEMYVKANESGAAISAVLKKFILIAMRDATWEALQEFANDLVDEHGKHLLVSGDPGESTSLLTGDDSAIPVSNTSMEPDQQSKREETNNTGGSAVPSKFSSWKDSVEFQAPSIDVFKALTETDRIKLWSRGPVEGSLDKKDDSFALFSGAVTGKVVESSKDKKSLHLSWRLSGWPASILSDVKIVLKDTPTGCTLELEQTGIPVDQFDLTSKNWTNYYWNPIKATFGYGAFPKY